MKNPLHNPLPASLSSECKKAAAIIESFINPRLKIDGQIPRKILAGAKGIAIFTAFRVGFLGSVRFGSGLIVARLPDGSWSAPSAMGMGGLGGGGQFGAELTDFVFVLTTDAAVKTFMQSGNLTLGGNISMAVGPIGRSAEIGGVLGAKGATGVFAYSKTRGLYGGLTVEGGVLAERADANKKLYGRKIRAKELLSGSIPPPPEAEALIEVLNGDFFTFEPSAGPHQEPSAEPRQESHQELPTEPGEEPSAEPLAEPLAQSPQEMSTQAPQKPPAEPLAEPLAQSPQEMSTQGPQKPPAETLAQPSQETSAQPSQNPPAEPPQELHQEPHQKNLEESHGRSPGARDV
ncbi:hypothetical protein N7475_008178 [Penicillium sp. IBT 31633x]|nr:hypothetical protein N7475_008178 [Penicillium sp. IBT 31633x]